MKYIELLPASATISDCKKYRYSLTRIWNFSKPIVLLIMFNPSKADQYTNDPTMVRVILKLRRMGYGGVLVGNLFAYRETDPYLLYTDLENGIDVVGPENDDYLKQMTTQVKEVIFATGNIHKNAKERFDRVLSFFSEVKCFKITKENYPYHPLYLERTDSLIKYK